MPVPVSSGASYFLPGNSKLDSGLPSCKSPLSTSIRSTRFSYEFDNEGQPRTPQRHTRLTSAISFIWDTNDAKSPKSALTNMYMLLYVYTSSRKRTCNSVLEKQSFDDPTTNHDCQWCG